MAVPPPLNRLFGAPSSIVSALRVLPDIAAHTEVMVRHTAILERIAESLERVSTDTDALRELRAEMARVAEATAVMDGRMANIESAMPVLVEVQRDLTRVPDTLARLDGGMERLSSLLEQMLSSLDSLASSVVSLEERLVPIGRIASFGRRRRNSRVVDETDADSPS
jgi:DNA repair ATPase RecN